MTAQVRLNPAGMRALLTGDQVAAIMLAEAEQVANRARGLMPTSSTWPGSISTRVVRHPSRVVARVQSDHPLAAVFEFGSRPRFTDAGQSRGSAPVFAPLTKALLG